MDGLLIDASQAHANRRSIDQSDTETPRAVSIKSREGGYLVEDDVLGCAVSAMNFASANEAQAQQLPHMVRLGRLRNSNILEEFGE